MPVPPLYSDRVDNWSVGCVAFQLLTKKKVWDHYGKIGFDTFYIKMALRQLIPNIPLDFGKKCKNYLLKKKKRTFLYTH